MAFGLRENKGMNLAGRVGEVFECLGKFVRVIRLSRNFTNNVNMLLFVEFRISFVFVVN